MCTRYTAAQSVMKDIGGVPKMFKPACHRCRQDLAVTLGVVYVYHSDHSTEPMLGGSTPLAAGAGARKQRREARRS